MVQEDKTRIMSDYHSPVLLKESLECLLSNAEGIYVDVTFGGGGHSKEILKKLGSKGKLIVFDQDDDAKKNLIEDDRIVYVDSNFRHVYRFWKWMKLDKVDGILADLGVSSHQFDEADRGFSYRFDSDLDMRMNQDSYLTASKILESYDESALQRMFSEYGEVRNSKTLAREIVKQRRSGKFIVTSHDLNTLLDAHKIGDKFKYFSQVYQAIRIEVNDEMTALKEMLEGGLKILKKGGKMVVISYHSIEDRMVKNFMKTGNANGEMMKDVYGRSLSKIKMEKKMIVPTDKEQSENKRSRSAKMRVGLKI